MELPGSNTKYESPTSSTADEAGVDTVSNDTDTGAQKLFVQREKPAENPGTQDEAATKAHVERPETPKSNVFFVVFFAFQVGVTAMYFMKFNYLSSDDEVAKADVGLEGDVSTYYTFYGGVCFMIYIGFGFLMSFLRRYSFSAIGFNMLISVFSAEFGSLLAAYAHNIHGGTAGDMFEISIPVLIEGLFASGAVMITFGAILGKASPLQLLLIATLEIIFYTINFYIGALEIFKAIDIGGSMFVHSWGAYFGLACSYALGPGGCVKEEGSEEDHQYNGSRTTSDATAMFGTIVLWLLWPSFNCALASPHSQMRVIVNTALSLNACCVSAFIFSRLLSKEGKFDMVHIQNATLAGGVAIGSSADLVGPGAAVVVGTLAGLLSVLGYVYVSDFLKSKLNLDDTCGVNNLHGMPGIAGGVIGAVATSMIGDGVYGSTAGDLFAAGRTPSSQIGNQFGALGVTLAFSIVSGLLTGAIVRVCTKSPSCNHGTVKEGLFEDYRYWEVAFDYDEC